MAATDFDLSSDGGAPVELYLFQYGESAYLAYCDTDEPVEYGGRTYLPLAITAKGREAKVSGDAPDLTVTAPLNSDIANIFYGLPPTQPVSLILRSGHLPDDGTPLEWSLGELFPVVWTGRVDETSRDDEEATLRCGSSSGAMRTTALRRHYQWPCPHVLFGEQCRASKAAALRVATITAISGNRVTVAPGWQGANASGDFIGGLVEWDSSLGRDVRGLLRVEAADVLVLNAATRDLAVGDTIDVHVSCPHTLDGCTNLHGNAVNYGGQPFIPTDNPTGKNNHT